MDGPESAGDDKSFTVNFSGEGAERLKDTVKEKLKEFLEDYQDDTLVGSDFPREYDGACLQMRMSYSPAANLFLSGTMDKL